MLLALAAAVALPNDSGTAPDIGSRAGYDRRRVDQVPGDPGRAPAAQGGLCLSGQGREMEGKGVIPDVPVAADEALRTAYLRALEKILAAERNADRRATLGRVIEEVQRGSAGS